MPELDLVSKGMTTCQGCAMELIARSALEVLQDHHHDAAELLGDHHRQR